ncbi:epoxide hydrolase [Verticillium alfalfae VaMs.102]|uniref:Epoxide hydrolase n=1 Tax=Verticillium alfalfae (strain VaMs.102 / ATCC MYA-4576 / FGSC 10136) TaxID=526221 RepID=C9SKM0_VERA1|nr:epoxide hydrolase [Verticillium alfalfae VaMs.102]EEY19238.1 epoxide hydrolase [Verticillium alfalfae VaMs.102]
MRSLAILSVLSWVLAVTVAARSVACHDLGFNHTRHYTRIGRNTYHYLLSKPKGPPLGTIVLLHGFPDLSYGWRYQIPSLTAAGYQVVAPDMLGYGRSSAPTNLARFTLKNMSDDLAALVRSIVGRHEQVILGGHDWGGALVYRAALWHPTSTGASSACDAVLPADSNYVDSRQIAPASPPSFGFQRSSATRPWRQSARHQQDPTAPLALYGGRAPEGAFGFDGRTGLNFSNLDRLGASPLVKAAGLEYYVAEYARNTMRGPLSWFRTAEANFKGRSWPLLRRGDDAGLNFTMPGLYIGATMDTALRPSMSAGMERYFPEGLARGEVVSSHWALWQAAAGVNKIVGEWIAQLA